MCAPSFHCAQYFSKEILDRGTVSGLRLKYLSLMLHNVRRRRGELDCDGQEEV